MRFVLNQAWFEWSFGLQQHNCGCLCGVSAEKGFKTEDLTGADWQHAPRVFCLV